MTHPIDKEAGEKLRKARNLAGMSQEKLAEAVGVTFQQIQKYEKGTNRMSVSRLWQIAGVLKVPVTYFFPGDRGSELLTKKLEAANDRLRQITRLAKSA